MSELIYLVGQISPKIKETYEWRRKIINHFLPSEGIDFIDPCNNRFNNKLLSTQEYAVGKEKRVDAIDVLPSKDYTYCKRSTMAVVNMNHYDKNKPMLGSFFELGWYYGMPEKTVIGFAEDLNDYQIQHPFVQQAVTVWCKNEVEAAHIIKEYFVDILGSGFEKEIDVML